MRPKALKTCLTEEMLLNLVTLAHPYETFNQKILYIWESQLSINMKHLFTTLLAILSFTGLYAQNQPLSLDELETHDYYTLEEALQNPARVYKLDLKVYNQTKLPAQITQFPNLQMVALSGNSKKLDWKTAVADLKKIPTLQYLVILDSSMTVIPADIFTMKNLISLTVADGRVTSLPPAIGQLTKLKYLYLDGNRIAALPAEITTLKNLEVLMLDSNPIMMFPAQFSKLKNLKELDLVSTKVTKEELEKLKKTMPQTKVVLKRAEKDYDY